MARTAVKSKKRHASRSTSKRAGAKRAGRRATAPTPSEVEARKAVARALFDPAAATAARAAFVNRQQRTADHAG